MLMTGAITRNAKSLSSSMPSSSLTSAYVSYLSAAAGMSSKQPGGCGMACSALQAIGHREFEAWKKRHKVKEGTKVFHVSIGEKVGVYEPMRAGLLRRGWVENSDASSRCFDFRWVNTGVNYESLRPQQQVNHFEEQQYVTTKAGLCETLRDCRWATDADSRQFYPRCYNLWDPTDRSHFIDDFRETAAVAVLRRVAASSATSCSGRRHASTTIPHRLVNLSLSVCRAKVESARYLVSDDDPVAEAMPPPALTAAEWDSLVSFICSHPAAVEDDEAAPIMRDYHINASEQRDSDHYDGSNNTITSDEGNTNRCDGSGNDDDESTGIETEAEPCFVAETHESTYEGLRVESSSLPVDKNDDDKNGSAATDDVDATTDASVHDENNRRYSSAVDWRSAKASDAAAVVLDAMSALSNQSSLNGPSNVWIVKPGGKSRGRGIALFNSLSKLLSYTDTMTGAEKWVAQKYIERPLIVQRRKFDIRQWVLVTSWNPLTVWFYEECYLRFTADEYDINDLDIFGHLSNNSISKYRNKADREDEITRGGNMWSVQRFQEHLETLPGVGAAAWPESIVPQMKAIARHSLHAAKARITPRRNSFALFGYDFMIDANMQVWLLEINKSPTMEPSTPITERLCREVQEDILKVVVDLPALGIKPSTSGGPPAAPANGAVNNGGVEGRKSNDATAGLTGKWSCIVCEATTVAKPIYFPGHDRLMCRGEGLKRPDSA